LIVTALGEGGTGLLLLIVPSFVIDLLLGQSVPVAETLVVARITGAALLCVGLACWQMRNDCPSAQRGLLGGVLIYDLGAAAALAYSGAVVGLVGIALWPAVVLHAALGAWCAACLVRNHGPARPSDAKEEPMPHG
jgi:hypothetical protein